MSLYIHKSHNVSVSVDRLLTGHSKWNLLKSAATLDRQIVRNRLRHELHILFLSFNEPPYLPNQGGPDARVVQKYAPSRLSSKMPWGVRIRLEVAQGQPCGTV